MFKFETHPLHALNMLLYSKNNCFVQRGETKNLFFKIYPFLFSDPVAHLCTYCVFNNIPVKAQRNSTVQYVLSVINNNETRLVHQVQGTFFNSNISANLNL